MVSFKFNTSKVANFTTDVPSKHGFQLNLIDITTKI